MIKDDLIVEKPRVSTEGFSKEAKRFGVADLAAKIAKELQKNK